MSQSVVKIDPEIMSGAPCFAGTRVPIQNLIDYLEGGESIEDFLELVSQLTRRYPRDFTFYVADPSAPSCSTNASM